MTNDDCKIILTNVRPNGTESPGLTKKVFQKIILSKIGIHHQKTY